MRACVCRYSETICLTKATFVYSAFINQNIGLQHLNHRGAGAQATEESVVLEAGPGAAETGPEAADTGPEAAALELWSWIAERRELLVWDLHNSDRETPTGMKQIDVLSHVVFLSQ